MHYWIRIVLYIFVAILLTGCKLGKVGIDTSLAPAEKVLNYDLKDAEVISLPAELQEISGLCYDRSLNQLIAVEDENGIIYTIDKDSGNILARDTFYKPGDYEGVAATEKFIYVLKSSGTLYKVKKGVFDKNPEKIKSFLKKDYDMEGLEYDPSTDALLITSKFYISEEKKNFRFIYRYDLNTEQMSDAPYLTIARSEVIRYIQKHFSPEDAQLKFAKILNEELDYMHLGPSAIAVHPITGNIYVISSQSKVLLVYDISSKELIDLQKLDKKIFEQPEGMCFDAEGSLYISSEGKKQSAKLIVLPASIKK